jgi:hypothetical protein
VSDPKIVDSYSLSLRERGGFQFVVLNILTDDQKTESYELQPAFAHALSDELLKASARAAPKVSAG